MNEYDASKIADVLTTSCNFTLTKHQPEADLIVLNTCSIREKAEEKIFSELGRLRLLKRKKPNLILAVGGCVAKQEQENIFRRAPYVDIVFGPQNIHKLPEMYNQASKKEKYIEKHIINTSDTQIEKFDYFPTPKAIGASALISIMEGCNKFCSYCIVPFTRGREVSRPAQDILQEIQILAQQNTKEICLLGQNVNAYKDPNKSLALSDLIYEIAKIEEIKRIRFTTSHPAEFTDDLISIFTAEKKLAKHLHLPIQSGSNHILKLMRRGYTTEQYQEIISKLKKAQPNISLSTDFIVGFPGETEKDFAQTLAIAKNINFDTAFSFVYSPRPNTSAIKLEDLVPLIEKKHRLMILQNQLATQTRKYNNNLIGTIQKILINSCAKKNTNQFSGRTESNRIVNFSAINNKIGDMVEVKITEALANSLRGDIFLY
jgi:tRNA-2-methylthio-N6-dimethylallyladenosine synthase